MVKPPPPLSFGTTGSLPKNPPLTFAEPAPATPHVTPAPLSFGAPATSTGPLMDRVASHIPFTPLAKDIISNRTAVSVGPVDKGAGAQTLISNPAVGKTKVTLSSSGTSPQDELALSHELFNSIFLHSNTPPDAFNAAWEKAKSSTDPNAAVLRSIDAQLNAPGNAAAFKGGTGENVDKQPYSLATERFAMAGKMLGGDGVSAIPSPVRQYYVHYVNDYPQKKPKAATNFGIALNTLNPLNLVKAAGKVGLSLLQAGASTAAAIAPSVVQLFDPKAQGAPLTPFMKRVLGEDKQTSIQEMAGHAAANETYPAEGLIGSLANPLAKKLRASPFAQKLGLDKAAPFLAVGSVLGDSFLNLGGFGDLAGDKALVQAIVKETDVGAIGSLLRRNGVSPEVADKVAPHLADMKNPEEVADALKVTGAVQHTADTARTLHPDLETTAHTEDIHPAAAEDWSANYADRYAQVNQELDQLKEDVHTGSISREEAGPKVQALVNEGATMEKDFIEKWQAPEHAVGPNALSRTPRPPRTAGPAAGIDVTNMSREDIAAKTAQLKQVTQVEQPFYHGTTAESAAKIKQTGFSLDAEGMNGGNGISLTTDPETAGVFSEKSEGNPGEVLKVSLKDGVRLVPASEFIDEKNAIGAKSGFDTATQKAIEAFKSNGYDGVDFRGNKSPIPDAMRNEVRIWNQDAIKVDSQEAQKHGQHLAGINPDQAEKLAPEAIEPLAIKATDQYWQEKIQPEIDNGRAIVIGADDLKDHFGGDYNDLNHPVYSRAAFKLYERALAESPHNVIFTGGGPGSGKTEILVKTLTEAGGFNGIVYDSTMVNLAGISKQIEMARAAGKEVAIYGITPDLERARAFTVAREKETGRGISDKTFARGHAGFPEVVAKLIEDGTIHEKDMHILDFTGSEPSLEEAKGQVRAGGFVDRPLAHVQSLGYNEDELTKAYGKDRFITGSLETDQKPSGPEGPSGGDNGIPQEDRGIGQEAPAKTKSLAPPPDSPVLVSEDDSLSLSAHQHDEWQYALRPEEGARMQTERDLEAVFADLEGVSLNDLGKTLTREDLDNAKAEVEVGEQVLLDHPGRALMKYVSRQTGDLPEMGKTTANRNRSTSKFAKEGDTLVQNLIGQEASGGGDVVHAQELVDEYRDIKERVDAARATFARIRKTISTQKKAGTFVENARRTLARELAKDTEALSNMVKSAERAGYARGKAAGAAKGEKMVADMVGRLKGRRERIEALQQHYRLPDRKMRQIMGRADPRFMKADAFESWYTKLAEGAERARASLDRYGPLPTTGEELVGMGEDGTGSWQSLIRDWYQNQGTKTKVNLVDYLGTPEYVLERLGMGKTAEKLHDAQDAYIKTRDIELKKIDDWRTRAGKRPEANTRIFKWLDGQERFVAPEMSTEELAVAHEIRDDFKRWADRLDLPEDTRIAKYITHLFEPGPRDEGASIFDDPDLARIMAEKPAGSVYDPFLEQRLGKKGYKEDTWGALDAYVKRASRKEAFDPVLSEMVDGAKTLDPSAYNYVARLSHSINMRPTETDKLIDNLITHGLKVTRYTDRPTAFLSGKLRQGFYRGTIGLNFSSALRNLSQGANTYAKLGEKYTTLGYSKVAWRLAKGDLSDLYESGVLADDYIQDRKVGVYKTMLQRLDPALYFLFETAEKINRGAAFYGAKAKAAAHGLSEEEATKYAKRMVRETQFAFTRVDTPLALNNDIGKTIGQLQTYNLKQLEFLGRMARNHEWAGLVRFTGATLAFVYTIGRMFGMNLNQVVPSVSLTGSPFGSGISALYQLAFGKSTNPLDQAKKERDLRNLLLSRIPAGMQMQKTVSGLEAVGAGKDVTAKGNTRYTIPQDFGHYLQAGLFGKSSLPEAQAYYDSLNTPKTSTTSGYQTPAPL